MEHAHQVADRSHSLAIPGRSEDVGIAAAQHGGTNTHNLYAYETQPQNDMPISVAPRERPWMDESHVRYAYRCLPLLIANQAGWFIHNPIDFTVVWDGGTGPRNVHIQFGSESKGMANRSQSISSGPRAIKMFNRPESRPHDQRISSHFGHGILTFSIPYLFRTPRAVNLWVKGPTNHVKDGIHPLEGIVETDWLSMTFTMNWKLTRPNYPVTFSRGEPICMILPVARGLAESLDPLQLPIETDANLCREYRAWDQSRGDFNKGLKQPDSEAARQRWQKHYFKGDTIFNAPAPEHQTRMILKDFKHVEPQVP